MWGGVFDDAVERLTDDAYIGRHGAAEKKKKGKGKMSDRGVKFCRNCVWSESGWCEVYQQPLKPCAGKCLAFLTRHVKKRKTQ